MAYDPYLDCYILIGRAEHERTDEDRNRKIAVTFDYAEFLSVPFGEL